MSSGQLIIEKLQEMGGLVGNHERPSEVADACLRIESEMMR